MAASCPGPMMGQDLFSIGVENNQNVRWVTRPVRHLFSGSPFSAKDCGPRSTTPRTGRRNLAHHREAGYGRRHHAGNRRGSGFRQRRPEALLPPHQGPAPDVRVRHVFNRTNQRIAAMTEGLSGVAALRAFCAEVLPLDEERVNEARIVIPFWQKALNDADMASLHSESMSQWHTTITGHCAAARAAGEIKAPHRGGRRRRRSPAEHDARCADRCGVVPPQSISRRTSRGAIG